MRISDTEVKRIISAPGHSIVDAISKGREEYGRRQDQAMVDAQTQEILKMPDREEVVEELRKQIASGQYNPTGEDIVEAMLFCVELSRTTYASSR